MALGQLKGIFIAVIVLLLISSLVLINIFKYTPALRALNCYISPRTDSIIRIIHQSWKNKDVPERFKLYSKSWTHLCFKHWKYMFWTDEDNLKLITKHYPWFVNKYNSLPSAIHRADVSRYFYLFHYGGIYTDLDNECLRPFEHLLDNFTMVFGAMKGQYAGTTLVEGYVQNSFMYSAPREPFWLEIIISVLNNPQNTVPEVQTGPVLLSNTIKRYRERGNGSVIQIYSPDYFNPFSWLSKQDSSPHCKDFNKMTDQDLTKCRENLISKGSYVAQYHAHTWG